MNWRNLLIALGLMGFWSVAIWMFQIPSYIIPSPHMVLTTFIHAHTLIFHQTITTLIETLIGLFVAFSWGIIAAISVSLWRPIKAWTLPLLICSLAIPTLVIAPLIAFWLDHGMSTTIATSILILFFPVTAAFYNGLKHTKNKWKDLIEINHANRYRAMLYIRLPSTMPAFAAGIRMAAIWAPIGAIMGEWIGSSDGLGFLILKSNAQMNSEMMFAAILVLIVISVCLYFITDVLLNWLIPWHNNID